MRRRASVPQILLAGASALALASVGGLALFYAVVLRGLPDIETLDDYRPNLITRVLDVGGNEVASFSKERRRSPDRTRCGKTSPLRRRTHHAGGSSPSTSRSLPMSCSWS